MKELNRIHGKANVNKFRLPPNQLINKRRSRLKGKVQQQIGVTPTNIGDCEAKLINIYGEKQIVF